MNSRSTGREAGSPETHAIRAWPCDSPAVTKRSIGIRERPARSSASVRGPWETRHCSEAGWVRPANAPALVGQFPVSAFTRSYTSSYATVAKVEEKKFDFGAVLAFSNL